MNRSILSKKNNTNIQDTQNKIKKDKPKEKEIQKVNNGYIINDNSKMDEESDPIKVFFKDNSITYENIQDKDSIKKIIDYFYDKDKMEI
jgi:hypothetical protein